jgi:general secretion pathway protein G
VIGYLGSSRSKTAKIQIEGLVTSLELFHIDVGRYPTTVEGLDSLVKQSGKVQGWNGPYISKNTVPPDPWGNPYHYQQPGKRGPFDLYTLGRDAKEGGSDEDADIYN